MDRRILCCAATALLVGGGLRAQTLSFAPPNPKPGDSVKITFSIGNCEASLQTAVTPPGSGNGAIQLTVTQGCFCVSALPSVTFNKEIGPLAFGTYDVALYEEHRDSGSPCSPPQLIASATLTVSRDGEVVGLRPVPARPVAGQPLTVGFDTFCPLVFHPPRIEPSGSETLIVLDQDPESPQPAAPCTSQPSWAVRLPVGPLAAGVYRLRVRMGPSSALLETVAESVFTVLPAGPALLLRQERFRVWADWIAPGFGQGSAQGVPLTDESGYFTFFSTTNVELIVKVLNGCPVNQRYWVFMAGLTNVMVTIYVEDTLTGRIETYVNPGGRPFQPVLDTSSFATCP